MSGAPIDRQSAFTGTREPAAALAIEAERLGAYLEAHVEGFRGPLVIRQFKGGQSNPTFLVEAGGAAYVLRRKPAGKLLPSAHAIEREFRVMAALGQAGFPVPRMHHLCSDPSVIGTSFYLMEYVAGRIFWVPAMPRAEPAERARVYDAMNETLARLHLYDPATLGLGDFGRGENYVGRQIARWSEQYRASRMADIAEMDRLMDWLPTRIPAQSRIAIVHGDYRLDNLILAADRPAILAVLDWELATLGDPAADFAYHLMQWFMPPSETGAGTGSLAGLDLAVLGIPAAEAYLDVYEARTGIAVRADLDFYLAYNFFRIAAILQGIVGRVRDGTATNPNAPAMAGQVPPLAATAWSFALRAGA